MKDRRRTFRSPSESLAEVRSTADYEKRAGVSSIVLMAILTWIGLFGVIFLLYRLGGYWAVHH
jgi:hypothetical protein